MSKFRITKLHVNAILSILVLAAMFGTGAWMGFLIITNAAALGCGVGEMFALTVGLLAGSSAGVVWVAKAFASKDENGDCNEGTN